ncbi:phosphate acetyltransferase [Culicoidibacter larvae]|uniref:Phosphate acetyltransferase n=1 Tax=Culicoidibacter larvae TaxID=2579976 RepID=A0A5R8QGZ4_9FIRM|nr:phosphate acetyltransferase [Culicoidibacter larvae]TLG77299.1 phosphate acetyltransferase [Culicoidibacter larvae]
MSIFDGMIPEIKGKGIRIVFPEGTDIRILNAAKRLSKEQLIEPILLGNKEMVETVMSQINMDCSGLTVIDPATYADFDKMVDLFVELRKGKATREQAVETLKATNYFGTMLVKMGEADGLVGGALYSTADTVRPALQIVKTKADVNKVSSMFYMHKDEQAYIFGDCAINVAPDAEDLADIAIGCESAAAKFGLTDPKIGLLSFSTKGSASGPEVDKVQEAVKILNERRPDLIVDGELQFDAAIVPSVGIQKAPGSDVAGQANILIFPSLEAGNIGYKIAQRLGGYEAIGPILLGLNAPINDLSRGCNEEDVYKLAIITAAQVR